MFGLDEETTNWLIVIVLSIVFLLIKRSKKNKKTHKQAHIPSGLDLSSNDHSRHTQPFAASPSDINLEIAYVDAEGNATHRKISVIATKKPKRNTFYSYCHLREGFRTFRFDRVQSAVNRDSGEIIENIRDYLT